MKKSDELNFIVLPLIDENRCQDSSVVRFWYIDPRVSGSNPSSAEPSLRVRRVASSL